MVKNRNVNIVIAEIYGILSGVKDYETFEKYANQMYSEEIKNFKINLKNIFKEIEKTFDK